MKWIDALKVWNRTENPGKWIIPKKDTKEYLRIKEIMETSTKDIDISEVKPIRIIRKTKDIDISEVKPIRINRIPKLSKLDKEYSKKLKRFLTQGWDTHEYKKGIGHPIDDIINYIKQMTYSNFGWDTTATTFLNSVIKYLKDKSFDATWNGEPQKVILLRDWDKIFQSK